MLRMFVVHAEEVIGKGAFGFVVRACIGGVDVAIKRATIGSMEVSSADAATELRQEIRAHKQLALTAPNILGDAVPRMSAVCEDAEDGEVLAMEGVSHALHSKTSQDHNNSAAHIWYVNDEKLDDDDKTSIAESAVSSLQKLHQTGFLHNDVCCRNVRVQKTCSAWRVGWIDHSWMAKPVASDELKYEVACCHNLFEE